MSTGTFPTDSANRKVVIILHRHDIEKCTYEKGAAHILLDEEAYVLPYPLQTLGEDSVALRNIVDSNLARPGSMLIQSPYDPDIYEEASLSAERFALQKQMHFSNLCMYLGAKEVIVKQIDLETRTGKAALNAKGERLGVNAEVSAESEDLQKLSKEMHLHDKFKGSEPDVDLAEQLLRRTGLWSDPKMRTLLEMRRHGGNPIRSRELVISLSSEAKSNLNVVARLKIPTFVKVSTEYDKVVREHKDYSLTVVVKF